jgi:nitrite reductase/ring-hydroxylating ferredoxin subunit
VDGPIDKDSGSLTCSQHKSSFDVKSGEVIEWLPGNYINRLQRMVSQKKCMEVYPTKVVDGVIMVNMAEAKGDELTWF